MVYILKRIKGDKTHFAAAVDVTGVVSKWVGDKKDATAFDEPTAKKAFATIGGKPHTGVTTVETEAGKEVARSVGAEPAKPSALIRELGEMARGKIVTLPPTPAGECVIVGDAGPVGELYQVLGMTTDPHDTTYNDVLATALQEIKDLRAMVEQDPADTALAPTTPASTLPAGSGQ